MQLADCHSFPRFKAQMPLAAAVSPQISSVCASDSQKSLLLPLRQLGLYKPAPAHGPFKLSDKRITTAHRAAQRRNVQ
jgi:hypothetical protein